MNTNKSAEHFEPDPDGGWSFPARPAINHSLTIVGSHHQEAAAEHQAKPRAWWAITQHVKSAWKHWRALGDRPGPARAPALEPLAQIVASGPANMPLLEWLSADHSFRAPIGSVLYAVPQADVRGDVAMLRAHAAEKALAGLVDCQDMLLRLRAMHDMGYGTDYSDYHHRLAAAWLAARAHLRDNP